MREAGAGFRLSRNLWFLKMFYLSIKYWNKYHILFFLRNYFDHFQKVISSLTSNNITDKLISNDYELTVDRKEMVKLIFWIIDLMNIVLKEIIVRFNSEKLHFNSIGKQNLVKRIKKHKLDTMKTLRKHRIEVRESVKEMMTCSWIGCCKKQKYADVKFKLCSGCKMSYYCSEYCQKKSWNTQHRYNCKTLIEYYNL
eukprot:508353_1